MATHVAYYRVSTQKQGVSGLGLEAQVEAVRRYLGSRSDSLIAEFTEVESGKKNDRPKMAAAIAMCRAKNATLVIAKLDRMARNVAFVANLMDSGVEFVACDFPQANRLTIHILAAVAEHEAKAISARTKAALAAKKARGERLGRKPGTSQSDAAKDAVRKVIADKTAMRDAQVIGLIRDRLTKGDTHEQIADLLNLAGKAAPRGGPFTRVQVGRIVRRNMETTNAP